MTMPAQDDAEVTYMRQVTALAKDLLATDDPYEVALEIHGVSAHASTKIDAAGSVWLIWGELTDRMELKPEENEQAEAEMVRAAQEWLSLDLADRKAVARYLGYWVHDVCGYARQTGSGDDSCTMLREDVRHPVTVRLEPTVIIDECRCSQPPAPS